MMRKKILVTGAAGFIGSRVAERLLEQGHEVYGLDNLNDYYSTDLKKNRLANAGIGREFNSPEEIPYGKPLVSSRWKDAYRFVRMGLEEREAVMDLMNNGKFDIVINFAAQAGVRHSISHPFEYVTSNIDGFANILEGCRRNSVGHLVFASSSSVYGLNGKIPFSEHDGIDHPVSLYAATKKSNELMAHAYSHLYNLPVTGLRFFTVYGPWGRPDMSPWLFMDAILRGKPIKVFNNGNMQRDFTYIEDVAESVVRIAGRPASSNPEWNPERPDAASSSAPYRIYNVGNSYPVRLMDYIECIERTIGRKAKMEMLPMQAGDVVKTFADSSLIESATGFRPHTSLSEGISVTVDWFREYYNL